MLGMISKSHLIRALLIAGALVAVGCEGDRAASTNGSLKGAISAYEGRQYAAAQQQAAGVAATSTGAERERAAYVAGMSAFQQGQLAEAEQHLLLAAKSSDGTLAGRAKAQLGLIRMKQNRPREASAFFSAAATTLSGEEGKKASQMAAAAARDSGDSSARSLIAMAPRSAVAPGAVGPASSTSSPENRPRSSEASVAPAGNPGKGFTLQVGAYQQRSFAEKAATDAQALSDRHGLGSVRIVNGSDERGRALHLVQMGRFDSPAAAASVRQRLGRLGYIVAPLAATAAR